MKLHHAAMLAAAATLLAMPASTRSNRDHTDEDVSPARRIERTERSPRPSPPPRDRAVRSIDGSGNHPTDTAMNAADTPLLRRMASDYADGTEALAGEARPGARLVSNLVCDQPESVENPHATSDFLWQWGQFLDHDIDLTDGTDPPEPAPIPVPAGDTWFDPTAAGDVEIAFNRSHYAPDSQPRQQLNEITGWIDASNVYGSDAERAAALRTLDGTGRLRTGPGDLLPDDDGSAANATGGSQQVLFLAGDVRANEQVALIAMHTLFVREHNRLAERIRARRPAATGDEVYEAARRHVGALMQAITYREFLPALLGPGALRPYGGYAPGVDARIANSFSTAAYRFGHSALPPTLLRLGADLQEIAAGSLPLRDAFFQPDRIRQEGGIEPLLRGLSQQRHQRIDGQIIDDVRNFLFGPPGAGGFDLAALNIQRGRDHGLPSYAAARVAYGLAPPLAFEDITDDEAQQAGLAAAYASVDGIDLWVGGLAEDPMPGGHLGPLFTRMIAEQFEALRDGDRFWYASALPPRQVREIERTRLSDVIRRNTTIGEELPDDVFRVVSQPPEPGDGRRGRRR